MWCSGITPAQHTGGPRLKLVHFAAFITKIPDTPTPTGLEESTAVHLQFVRQCAPPIRIFVPSWLLSFCTYAFHLCGSACEKVLRVGVTGQFLIALYSSPSIAQDAVLMWA